VGGFITFGEVVNVADDPTQSGLVRVKWQLGAATQTEVPDTDLPWTKSVLPSTNPSLKQTGGPHTGLQKGSRVVGVPIDGSGQEFLIIGSIVSSGTGKPDEKATLDSDIPRAAKVEENGGEKQPRHGDVNDVVTQKSITKYAEEEGGSEKKAARFPQFDDAIGTYDRAIA
jgi:hypothetical protein